MYIQYDKTLAEFKPEKYFEGERMLLRELISRKFELQAVKTDEYFITNKSMQTIIPTSNFNINYLLACINSKLVSWYFLNISQIAQRDDFPKIVLRETRSLPIFPIDFEDSNQLSYYNQINEIVENIYLTENTNSGRSINDKLDKQLDDLIYQLYNLTEEEITIVENHSK